MYFPCPCKFGREGCVNANLLKVQEMVNDVMKERFPNFICVDVSAVDCCSNTLPGYWELHITHSTDTQLGWIAEHAEPIAEMADLFKGSVGGSADNLLVLSVQTNHDLTLDRTEGGDEPRITIELTHKLVK